jgi:hypothetical protein
MLIRLGQASADYVRCLWLPKPLPTRRIPFGDLSEAETDIYQEQRSANRGIRREGKLNTHNLQSTSLLQPAIAFSVEIHSVALLVVLRVVSLDSLGNNMVGLRWWGRRRGGGEGG